MRILFLAPTYMGLYKNILSEMIRMRHEVVFLEDVMFEWDWKIPWMGMVDRVCRRLKCIYKRSFEKYWENKFAADIGIDKQFDLLFAINGCSLHQSFFNRIQKHSPHLKKVLYLWDNSQFFDYYHYAYRFDKVLTYDIDDSVKFKAELLPFYWEPISSEMKEQPLLYKMVGSNHNNRLKIAKAIASQLRERGINYCFKILDKSLKENDIVIHSPLSTDSVQKIMMQSDCILDTDRESQSGTTPRLIWALAMGKKVITTNQNIKRMPFYDAELIHIIDRNNPIVDMDFIESQPDFSRCQKLIQALRIDIWIKNFCV